MWREEDSNVFALVHLVGTEVGFYPNRHARVSTAQLLPRFTPGSCQVGHNSDSQVPTTHSTAQHSLAHHRGPGIKPLQANRVPHFALLSVLTCLLTT
ncbi:unnamed protein product [Sphagnum troendelagicum]|uniref:Uncharacterized protein n=1 Tax=Sphagnum troendelagicum TaxID=128251 RepID=A0ABP0TA72_9BRYO